MPYPIVGSEPMSPVERRPPGSHTGRAVLVTVAVIGVALAGLYGVATLASRGDVEMKLGDDRFIAGSASDILDRIVDDGAPIGFNDPARRERPIWVDNSGDDPDSGWIAISAYLPDDPTCLVQWDAEAAVYVAECDPSVTFPRSGEGLREFDTEITDGRLEIDLRDSGGGN